MSPIGECRVIERQIIVMMRIEEMLLIVQCIDHFHVVSLLIVHLLCFHPTSEKKRRNSIEIFVNIQFHVQMLKPFQCYSDLIFTLFSLYFNLLTPFLRKTLSHIESIFPEKDTVLISFSVFASKYTAPISFP